MKHEDLDRVLEIARAAFDPPWTREQFALELERPHAVCSVIAVEGAVVAYSVAWFLPDELEVLSVATEALRRRSGHGRALVREILREATRRGTKRGFLEVRADNAAAIALYASLGFSRQSVRARYYADGADAWVMEWQAAT